jgi:two-component system chemotaxis response regulator CheY
MQNPEPAPGKACPRILVVDDATIVRLYYRQILETAGYEVDEAINGLEGLEKAAQTAYDLCIVDINMPIMDGYAFLHALRHEPGTHAVPAMTTTTEAAEADHLAALQAGANAYLVKPVPRDHLRLYVDTMLGRRAE